MWYGQGMVNRSSRKKPRDLNKLAQAIVDEATGDVPPDPDPDEGKNPNAVALGRLGGLKGGAARARKLSKKRRSEIAREAAKARWKDKLHK
jgi:hypothetical protein